MPDTIGLNEAIAMLRTVAGAIKANQEHFSKLDAATGDGDHGAAMGRVADVIAAAIDKETNCDLKTLFRDIGWSAMSAAGGSTSTLYGSFFMGMSEGAADRTRLDGAGLTDVLESGMAKLRKNTKAEPGNKTLIDALVPAVRAMRAAASDGLGLDAVLAAAADAAREGAESTTTMQATFGRAKNLGERSVGHVDPGAASMACFFAGLKEGLPHA